MYAIDVSEQAIRYSYSCDRSPTLGGTCPYWGLGSREG